MRISDWSSDVCSSDLFAYQQLSSEGYLESRERSGHFVADDVLSGRMAPNSTPSTQNAPPSAFESRTSVSWDQRLSFHPSTQRNIVKPANWQKLPYPFVYGQFDASQFPTAEWRECCTKALSVLANPRWAPAQH